MWFRAGTRKEAERLGLTGYARNLADGRVEVLACGEEQPLTALKRWLQRGTPAARVDELSCEPSDSAPPAGFTTR